MSKSVLHLDLHPIAKNSLAIETALSDIVQLAVDRRVKTVEIITGKGSGQLMKRVQKWLQQPHIKRVYKRVDVDSKNHGRLFVHFR